MNQKKLVKENHKVQKKEKNHRKRNKKVKNLIKRVQNMKKRKKKMKIVKEEIDLNLLQKKKLENRKNQDHHQKMKLAIDIIKNL